MSDKKDGIWTTSEKNMFQTGQIVNEQGEIVPGQNFGSLPRGDWTDSSAYRAQAISQAEQRAYDLSLWQYQQKTMNDYNSPAAQMARFGEAGLNPNLIYQQQNTASPVSMHSSAPLKAQSNFGRQQAILQQATGQLLGALQGTMSLKEKEADIQMKQAQTKYVQEQAGRLAMDNQYNAWLLGIGDKDFSDSIKGTGAGLDLNIKGNQVTIQGKRLDIYDQQLLNMMVDMAYKQALIARTGEQTETNAISNGIFTEEIGSKEWWKSVGYHVGNAIDNLGSWIIPGRVARKR